MTAPAASPLRLLERLVLLTQQLPQKIAEQLERWRASPSGGQRPGAAAPPGPPVPRALPAGEPSALGNWRRPRGTARQEGAFEIGGLPFSPVRPGSEHPDMYGATQGLLGAASPFLPLVGKISSKMAQIRHLAEMWRNFSDTLRASKAEEKIRRSRPGFVAGPRKGPPPPPPPPRKPFSSKNPPTPGPPPTPAKRAVRVRWGRGPAPKTQLASRPAPPPPRRLPPKDFVGPPNPYAGRRASDHRRTKVAQNRKTMLAPPDVPVAPPQPSVSEPAKDARDEAARSRANSTDSSGMADEAAREEAAQRERLTEAIEGLGDQVEKLKDSVEKLSGAGSGASPETPVGSVEVDRPDAANHAGSRGPSFVETALKVTKMIL